MPQKHDQELENRLFGRLMDVLIRAGLILALVMTCYTIFSPFMSLMMWALILAVIMYPVQQWLSRMLRGHQGLASTLLVLASAILIVIPCAILMSSLADSISGFIGDMRDNTLKIPLPSDSVAQWPVIGKKLHLLWHQAATDLPGLIQKMQPKLGTLARKALGMVASIGTDTLKFLISFVIAGIIMAYGQSGAESAHAISRRVVGELKADMFMHLCTATIRAVAQGVIGVAFIQAILVGLALYFAAIPATGILAVLILILGIAQIPPTIVTIPVIIFIWSSGDYSTGSALFFSVLLLLSGMADNVLKPLLLGRGVDVPMPVILLGALGGMVAAGLLGMFIGATLLMLGYLIFMNWVEAEDPGQQRQNEVEKA